MTNLPQLTELENKALLAICKELSIWRDSEPGYSCIDGNDVSIASGISKKSIAGVIGSLCKKGYIESDSEDFDGIIYPHWDKIPTEFGR